MVLKNDIITLKYYLQQTFCFMKRYINMVIVDKNLNCLTRGDMIACARVLYTICLPIAPEQKFNIILFWSRDQQKAVKSEVMT